MSGSRRVRIGLSADGDYVAYAEKFKLGVGEPEVGFSQAIDGIFAGNGEQKSRVHQQSLDTWGPLNEESPPIPYVQRKLLAKNIWMGSRGNVTKLHYDTEDNINVQLRGSKEVILYPSAQLDELYPRRPWEYMANFSRVDIEKPDLARFPLFSRATPWRAVLQPGDFLYIPIYWWHQFYTLDASINVNFWWQARTGQAMRRQGVRYWPRMAKDGYLHRHILQAISNIAS
jgi:hypothetical protein